MNASAQRSGVFTGRVRRNVALCREHFRLTLIVSGFPHAEPGQFVQVECHEEARAVDRPRVFEWAPGAMPRSAAEFSQQWPVLRRPFSIAGLRSVDDGAELDLIGRTVGPGTRWLATRQIGDAVGIIGPLGRAFKVDSDAVVHVLVAGGVGLPPLLWLGESIQRRGLRAIGIAGARSGDLLPLQLMGEPDRRGEPIACAADPAWRDLPVVVTTDDGSRGLHGTTADALRRVLERLGHDAARAAVYTCGPEAMMRAVSDVCAALGVPCRAALERVMGCGMGTCQSCVVALRDDSARGWHYELCCTQGPVFDAARVIW